MTVFDEVSRDLDILPGREFSMLYLATLTSLRGLVQERRARIGRAAAELVNAIGTEGDSRIQSVSLEVDSVTVTRFVMPLEVDRFSGFGLKTYDDSMPIPVSSYVSKEKVS